MVAFVYLLNMEKMRYVLGAQSLRVVSGRRVRVMKRRVIAWLTAAAMLFTSVPANAMEVLVEEAPQILAEEVQEDAPVVSEAVPDPVVVSDAVPEAAEYTEDVSEEILTLESPDETEAEVISADDADSLDGLVEDFTVEEDLQEPDAFVEEEIIPEETEAEEVLIAAEEGETTGSEVTDISLSFGNPAGVFTPGSGTFLYSLMSLIANGRSTITTSGAGRQYCWFYITDTPVTIDHKNVYILREGSSSRIGLLPYDAQTNELIANDSQIWTSIPNGRSVKIVPFELDSQDYDKWADRAVTLAFPEFDPSALPLTDGSAVSVGGSSRQWYEYTGSDDNKRTVSLTADGSFTGDMRLLSFSQSEDAVFQNKGVTSFKDSFAFPYTFGPNRRYYLYVANDGDKAVNLSIDTVFNLETVTLPDVNVSTYELTHMSYQSEFFGLFSVQAAYADGKTYGPRSDSAAWSGTDGDGNRYLSVDLASGDTATVRFLDEDGNTTDLDIYNYALLTPGSYRMRAEIAAYDIDTGSYRTIYSDPAVLTVTATPPSATELGCDAAAGFSAARGQTAYFSPAVETSGSYRFTLTGSTQGWNTLIAELSKVNPDNTYTSIVNSSFLFYEEEMSNSFTADLEEGTAYLLSLRMPNGDGVTIDGTIQFTANGSGSADSEIIKETIAAGETKTAVWPADVQTQYEYTFVPEEAGNYRIFSEGSADTYVTLYSSEGEVREQISEDDDDGEGTNFSLKKYLEAGKTYVYVARPYGSGDGSSSLITLERCYGIETAELTFSGTSEPRFVEGLYFDGAAAPLWALGEVTATFTYEDNSSEQIVIGSGDEIITKNGEAYQIYSVAGFDENGEPVGLSEYDGPAAGSWYAVLASSEWDGEEDRYTYTFVPSQKQEGDWKPSLETVSAVPFTVVTKQEAASGVSLQDNERVSFDQGNTYYVGMTVTTDQSGEVTLSSDLAMSTVRVFGPSEENPAVLSEVSVSLKDEYTARMKLDAGTEYYVFVRPSAATRFTVESVRLVSLTGAVLTTDLPSTITTQRVVRTEDFGVDLTYDDDSTVHLTGAQSDAYGNSFFYRAESDSEGYGYQFRYAEDGTTLGADRYTVSGQMNVTGSYITTGSYIATASDVVTDNTVSLEVVRPSGSNTVSTGSVETIANGNTAQFTFVPEEDGYYTILGNGDPLICELDYEGRSPVNFDGATYYLYANTTYYIDVPVSADDQDISVTRRYPVTLSDENPTLSVHTQAGRNTQFLFTVTETGVYDLSVAAPAQSAGLSLSLFGQRNRYSAGLLSYRYETNNPAVIPVILKAGTIYLLNSYMFAENSSEDVFDLALTAEKRSSDTGVQASLNAADSLNYPAIFAEDLLRGVGVQETAGGSTTIVPFESPSEVTGYNYYWLGISGAGDTRTVRFESEGPNEDYKTHSKEITFTGDLGSAPDLTENTVCNTGVEMERTWFYRFTPEKTAYYHVAVECPGSGYYVIREEETGRAVSSDSPRLTEGKAYIIAAFYESASESPAVTVRSIVNVDSVEIVNAPESALLQNLSSRTGFSVKLSYSDGTESTYDLAMNNTDRQGYAISLAGYVLPVRAGETKKARVRVSAGGRQDYCDIPLGSSGINTITENLQDAAALPASDESLWYRFTPSADAYYEMVVHAGDTSGYGYSWEVYAEESTVPMSWPAYLKQGNTYIVSIMVHGTVSDLQAAMLRRESASSSSLVSLTYEYAAEDGTTELPAEVTSLAPAGTQLMKDSEVKVAAPGKTVVKTSDATYTFLGYDYAGETIRLYEDTTIIGTWAVDPVRSYKVSYRFENGNEQDGLSLPEEVTALTPEDVWYKEGDSVTIQNPARTEVTTQQGYWSFNGYDKADFTMGTADVVVTGTWTYTTEEHQVRYVFGSNSGISLPDEVMNLCPDPETAVKGTMVIPRRPASEAVTVPGQGIWYFGGYTPSSAKMRRADLTFTGYWTYEEFASSEITVTFNGGEGSAVRISYDSEGKPIYGEGTTYSKTVAAGDTVTLAADLFYREGYQIRSWTDDSGNTYPADADQAFTESVVLTANWKAEGEQECIHENMVHHPRVEATCTEAGNIEYYECPDCEKKFSDAAGEDEITGSVILPASGHSMTYHQAVEATCTEAGNIAYYECANCGRKFSDEAGEEEITGSVIVSAHGHSMIHHDRVEPTSTEDGNIEYYECSNCGKFFSDLEGTNELDSSSIILPKVGGILDIYKNADEVEPGKTYTDIDAMYKLRIDREGEFKFYVDTDVAGLKVPFYTDLTHTFSGMATVLDPGDEYFFEYFSEGNGNIAEDGYAYFNFKTSDENHTSFAFRAYPQIRINAPDDAIHDGGATEDIYADKGSDRTFTVDASSPYGEIRYVWGIKDWSGATSEGEFKPLGDDTGTSTYTLKDIKYSYTELVCRMMVLSDDGTPMEETAKDYCFCIHVEGGDDPEDDVTEWGMYTGTVSTADTVAPGSEVTFTVDVHNTMDIASKPSVYVWYYQEKYNSETYPGVEFGTLTGEGYSTEDGTLSLEAYGNRTLTLTGTIPQTWNDQSQILLVFLDYENDKAGQIEYPVEAVPGEYTVTYKFVCESGEELPGSILALCPNPEIHYTGEWVEATYPARQKVDEGDSIWSFEGYDIEDFQMGTADVTVTGTWMYRPKTDSEIAADALVNLSDGSDSMDPNAIVDLLENANSSEILGRLEEILGEEPGNDEDGLNDALAQTTAALDEQLVDDSDVPDGSKKITVSSGSQTTGAYVGNTSAGQTEDGVSVAISGAAATVASVIRSQDVDKLAQNEDKHYQAVVSVDVVEKQNDSLTLDISLDVKVAETGQVVENDIEPVSPVTVTITLPDEYVGYDLTVIHTTRSGEVEEVSYSFINGGKQIQFTVSSLSPFELQILECMHSNLTPVTGLIATCAMDGRLGHWVCGTCGKKFLDEDCEQEVTDAQLVIPKSSYHTWNSTVTVAATEDTTGVMTHTCAVCGQSWTEVIPKTPVNITISKKPSKFKAKAEKKGKVTLTWTKLANKGKTKALYKQVKNIEIQYSTDSTFATGVKKKILSKKKAKYSVKLSKNTKYYFRIRYCDGKGGYSNWVVKSVKTKKK